jgi:hypothetical protein
VTVLSSELWTAIGSIATAITVAVAAVQIAMAGRQERTQFEDGLVKEYRELLSDLSGDVLLQLPAADDLALIKDQIQVYYRYFDLCNEQVFLRQKNRIRPDTWREWRSGIMTNLQRSGFRGAWELVCEKTDSFVELRTLCHEPALDPRSRRWRRAMNNTAADLRARRASSSNR